ncbi:MAG TPA: hypothetical protein VH853_14635 [Polyangia bacterium]|jgi:hypothetical protein|nr:hypothetical protein [Polyangia bacterium]
MFGAAVALGMLVAAVDATPTQREDCDATYNSEGRAQDFDKALACYRAEEEWTMLAIMQLNGEGTPVDVAGARASFLRLVAQKGEKNQDMDDFALDKIIKEREADPRAKARRVVFCRDVAMTTISVNVCDAQEQEHQAAKGDAHLQQLRARLDPRMRAPFDRVVETFHAFVPAESTRAYQAYIDGSIRNQFATSQEALVRSNFSKTLKLLTASRGAAPPPLKRSWEAADRQLNDLYKADVRGYVAQWEKAAAETAEPELKAKYTGWATDYRRDAHAAQHQWILYRDAMAKLAAARRPAADDAEGIAKALVTEDRLRELHHGVGEGR